MAQLLPRSTLELLKAVIIASASLARRTAGVFVARLPHDRRRVELLAVLYPSPAS